MEGLTGTTGVKNTMSAAQFSMKDLIEAGVHFGHKTKRWNPKMAPFIYGVRNDTHIIDLNKTVPLMHNALQAAYNTAKAGGRILFVGTKRQASDVIADAAKRSGHFYVNHRWLGGMLTNWNTIQNSIRRLQELEGKMQSEKAVFTKKELLNMERQAGKLEMSLGGIRKMGGVPNLIIVIDVVTEDLAIKEAVKLNVPVIGIVDTNADVAGITYPVPGNDDATKAVALYCDLFAQAIRQGMKDGGIALPEEVEAREAKKVTLTAAAKEAAALDKVEIGGVKATTKKEAMAATAKLASNS
jgi:small subunit ribosomal protein S2